MIYMVISQFFRINYLMNSRLLMFTLVHDVFMSYSAIIAFVLNAVTFHPNTISILYTTTLEVLPAIIVFIIDVYRTFYSLAIV